jgi:hypothetical protein
MRDQWNVKTAALGVVSRCETSLILVTARSSVPPSFDARGQSPALLPDGLPV